MKKLLSCLLSWISLAAGISSATILTTVPGLDCVGENTPSCPGSIEIFSGNPGTFLAAAVAEMSEVQGPLNVPLGGTIISAVFRDPGGQLGFYYQMILNQESAAIQEFLIAPRVSLTNDFNYNGSNVGARSDGLGAFGPVTFVPSAHEPANISLLDRNHIPREQLLHVLFGNNQLQAGEASTTLAVLSDAPTYSTNGLAGFITAIQPDGNDYGFLTYGILGPAQLQVAEPATLALTGLGLLVVALIFRESGQRCSADFICE